jgi:hypothetical protein
MSRSILAETIDPWIVTENTIGRLVQEHREKFLEGWYEFFGG